MKNKIILIFIFVFAFAFAGVVHATNMASIDFSYKGRVVPNQNIRVDVYVNSNTEVNAAQLKILYPEAEFSLVSVDSQSSDFKIEAEETVSAGSITIARGNIQPLKGKRLLTTLVLTPKTNRANISNIDYEPFESLVMSIDNENILTDSKVSTVKPITPTPTIEQSTNKGLFFYLKEAVGEFFRGLFRGWGN